MNLLNILKRNIFLHKILVLCPLFFNHKTLFQLVFPKTIPIIIINFNQLKDLKNQIDFYLQRNFKKIVIIDNQSTYSPLLNYYNDLATEKRVVVKRMDENYGHLVFFENEELYNTYGKGFFILTDADITPNEKLPKRFIYTLFYWLLKNYQRVNKVGFALEINNIPEEYPSKDKVIAWEKNFWKTEIAKNIYLADIDTTFALYKPDPNKNIKSKNAFFNGIRIAGNFTAKHGGWYLDYNNLTEEQKHYINTATKVSIWAANKGNELKFKNYEK